MDLRDDLNDVLDNSLDYSIGVSPLQQSFTFPLRILSLVKLVISLLSEHISDLFVHRLSLIQDQHQLRDLPVVGVFHLSFQILIEKLPKLF